VLARLHNPKHSTDTDLLHFSVTLSLAALNVCLPRLLCYRCEFSLFSHSAERDKAVTEEKQHRSAAEAAIIPSIILTTVRTYF